MINKEEKDYSQLYAELYIGGIILAICVGSAMIITSLLGGCDTNRPPMIQQKTTGAINTPPPLKATVDPPIETCLSNIEVINELPGEPNLEPVVIQGSMVSDYQVVGSCCNVPENVIIPSNNWDYVGFVAIVALLVCLFGKLAIALWQSGQRK